MYAATTATSGLCQGQVAQAENQVRIVDEALDIVASGSEFRWPHHERVRCLLRHDSFDLGVHRRRLLGVKDTRCLIQQAVDAGVAEVRGALETGGVTKNP